MNKIILFSFALLAASPLLATNDLVVPAALEKTLTVNGSHLIVPVANYPKGTNSLLLGIYDGGTLVQNFTVALPQGNDAFWLAAYPLEPFGGWQTGTRVLPRCV